MQEKALAAHLEKLERKLLKTQGTERPNLADVNKRWVAAPEHDPDGQRRQ